jgi:hypothetical protein
MPSRPENPRGDPMTAAPIPPDPPCPGQCPWSGPRLSIPPELRCSERMQAAQPARERFRPTDYSSFPPRLEVILPLSRPRAIVRLAPASRYSCGDRAAPYGLASRRLPRFHTRTLMVRAVRDRSVLRWPGCSGSCPRPARRVKGATSTRLTASAVAPSVGQSSPQAVKRLLRVLRRTAFGPELS